MWITSWDDIGFDCGPRAWFFWWRRFHVAVMWDFWSLAYHSEECCRFSITVGPVEISLHRA